RRRLVEGSPDRSRDRVPAGSRPEPRPIRRAPLPFLRASLLERGGPLADFGYPLFLLAGVAEWQTQGTQNPPLARACRFESGLRHHGNPRPSEVDTSAWRGVDMALPRSGA